MKVLTIAGTRPELIRMCLIVKKLDYYSEHRFVYTGQNYTPELKDIFFGQLGIREPDYNLDAHGTFGEQAGIIFGEMERIVAKEQPDRLLVHGDTNSSLGAIVAKRMGIPIFHVEAGNRCWDNRVPEEVNRKLIDSCSDIHMVYSNRSKDNLLAEGVSRHKIHVVGNPILEVMEHFWEESDAVDVLTANGLESKKYFLVTIHRADMVDDPARLSSVMDGLSAIANEFKLPVLVPMHPHTQQRLKDFRLDKGLNRVQIINPVGFLEFLKLERHATCILTDSGVVSEEAAILKVPNVILRDTTERAEVLECGSGIMSGTDYKMIKYCVYLALQMKNDWEPPEEYMKTNVSDTVVKILLGKYFEGGCK